MLELRHLRAFVAVAEEMHFGRAAHRLGIAQSALSAQIATLENHLGIRLLTRTTRAVEFTEAGRAYYDGANATLMVLDDTAARARAIDGQEDGHLQFGTISAAMFGVLPTILNRVKSRFPDLTAHIVNGNTETIVRDIERGRLNFGLIRNYENIGALRFRPLLQDRYLLALSRDHRLAELSSIPIDALHSEALIAFSRSNLGYTERYFTEQLKSMGLAKRVRFTCDDTMALIALVSAGLGVGFAPSWTRHLPDRGFVLRPVDGISFRIGLGLAARADDPNPRHAAIFDLIGLMADDGLFGTPDPIPSTIDREG